MTIVMSIPTIVASFYGMNVNLAGMPFAGSPYGFGGVVLFSFVVSLVVVWILFRANMF